MFYAVDLSERLKDMLTFDLEHLVGPLFSSLLIIVVLLILGSVIGIKANKAVKNGDYKKAPRGILFWADAYYDYVSNFTISNMGNSSKLWSGYFFTLWAYLFIAFNVSLLGVPSVIDWLPGPLCLSIIMFFWIHVIAIKYQHWSYLKRYIDPIPVFLPVNLITMWSPIISTTMRMFGNALAGTVIITLLQWALSSLSATLFTSMGASLEVVSATSSWSSWWNSFPYWTGTILSPIPIGILNAYFSLFSGFVQTMVFASLSSLWIAQEKPMDEDNVYLAFRPVPKELLAYEQKDLKTEVIGGIKYDN